MKKFSKKGEVEGRSFFKKSLFLFVIVIFATILFSCKSAPEAKKIKVDAFDTLEHDSTVYVRIPVKKHIELTSSLLKSLAGNMQDKYVKNITDNIDVVYIGSGSSSNKKRLQIACDGNLSSGAKMALGSMDNWKKEAKNVNAGVFTVYTEANSKLQLCLPDSDLLCLSKDLTPQLALYEKEANAQIVEAATQTENSKDADWKNGEAYNFVGKAKTDNIRIYIDAPVSFVTNLLGVSLSTSIFQLNFIEAEVRLLPNKKYAIDLDMEFTKSGLVSRALSFLNVAFLLTDSEAEIIDDTHLRVTGIQVSMSQMQKMLGL